MLVAQSYEWTAYGMVDYAVRVLAGSSLPEEQFLPFRILTPDSISKDITNFGGLSGNFNLICFGSYFEYGYSIKLFEYLGYGLPVVYVHNTPMDRFVTENGMGIGVECDPESFARGVRALFEEPEKYAQYRANACQALVSGNTWNHRVRQLVRELSALDGRK